MADDTHVPLGDMFSKGEARRQEERELAIRAAQERAAKEAEPKPKKPKKVPLPPKPTDPDAVVYGHPRYGFALPGETLGQFRVRMVERLARGRKNYRERKKKEKEERERIRELRETNQQMVIEERMTKAIERKARQSAQEVDLAVDILWVYENLDRTPSRWLGAPSNGALGMLRWAKKDQDKFYGQMVTKALAMQGAREEAAQEKEEKRKALGREDEVVDMPLVKVERLLREFAGQESKK